MDNELTLVEKYTSSDGTTTFVYVDSEGNRLLVIADSINLTDGEDLVIAGRSNANDTISTGDDTIPQNSGDDTIPQGTANNDPDVTIDGQDFPTHNGGDDTLATDDSELNSFEALSLGSPRVGNDAKPAVEDKNTLNLSEEREDVGKGQGQDVMRDSIFGNENNNDTITGFYDPIAIDDNFTVGEEQVLVIESSDILANDLDVDDEVLEIVSVDTTSAGGANVFIDKEGNVVYESNDLKNLQELFGEGQEITDSFDYTITDGNGGFSTGTITVTVAGSSADLLFSDF